MGKLRVYLDTSVVNFLFADDDAAGGDGLMRKTMVSKALRDVWDWKEACWRDVAHLPLEQAIAKRLRDATEAAKRLGFVPEPEARSHAQRVAEPRSEYNVSRRRGK